MKILLARPDVSIPLYAAIVFFVGAIGGIGASIWYVAGRGSMCHVLPVFSVSSAFIAILPWKLHGIRPGLPGRRTAGLLIAFALFTAVEAALCRV